MSWIDKQVYVELRSGRRYSGKIVAIDDSDSNIIFITIIDKKGNRVLFVHSEINAIQEEQ